MRLFIPLLILALIQCSVTKNTVKSLTESLGQEVIEIGAPIKDLPPDLEEEPSAENDEDDKLTTAVIQVATKKDFKKMTTGLAETRRRIVDKSNLLSVKDKTEDEESRIEKELAEIYKDNTDYKADSIEIVKEVKEVPPSTTSQEPAKPIARARTNFKFQPDTQNKKEIERFRTSVDEISCQKVKLLATTTKPRGNMATKTQVTFATSMIPIAFLSVFK